MSCLKFPFFPYALDDEEKLHTWVQIMDCIPLNIVKTKSMIQELHMEFYVNVDVETFHTSTVPVPITAKILICL